MFARGYKTAAKVSKYGEGFNVEPVADRFEGEGGALRISTYLCEWCGGTQQRASAGKHIKSKFCVEEKARKAAEAAAAAAAAAAGR